MRRYLLRIRNASQIVQVCANKEQFKKGTNEMNKIAMLEHASIVVSIDGKVVVVDKEEELLKQDWYNTAEYENEVDGTGLSIIPGFVDGHTHPVWSGDRVHEWEMKIEGATYMDIHKSGGGIGFTVAQTRQASKQELLRGLLDRLDRMASLGTTAVEAKSGYGLDTETEMKMLQVIHEAKSMHPVTISTTFLGAHSVPKESTLTAYTDQIIKEQLPELTRQKKAGKISPDNIDVFHEKGVFETDETRRILKVGKDEAGLNINFHGDELHPMASAELGAELNARAISHLEEISDTGIQAMASNNIFAVLLPTTAYILRIKPPPARKLVDSGVPVALGSDFNPNAFCMSMPHVLNLACTLMRMSLKEALVAATINSAASLGLSDAHGSIEPGKQANFVLINHPDWRHIAYEMAHAPIHSVYIKGKIFPPCRR